METRQRTVVKALLWQALGLAIMLCVGVLATGSVALGGAMAVTNTSVGLITYIVYERLWARVSWGRA